MEEDVENYRARFARGALRDLQILTFLSVNESHSRRREKQYVVAASDILRDPNHATGEDSLTISVPPQTERKHIILDNDSPEAITMADHLKNP